MKSISLFAALMLCALWSNAQVDLKQVVPPNPNVASLFKSVITPVTEYSGLPNVSIPLYTVNEGGISVPLSLSYATGGIQVSEESGIVGLGWALNAGGAITRTISGTDDFEALYGYAIHSNKHPDLPVDGSLQFPYWRPDVQAFVDSENTLPNQETCYFLVDGQQTIFSLPQRDPQVDDYDYMPDIFHFNFNGYSGSFVLDSMGNPFLLNKKGIRVLPIGTGSQGFIITTEDGTIYEFSEVAMTTFPFGNEDDYVSSWFLSKITDIYDNQVTFHYDASRKVRPFRTFSQSFISTPFGGEQTYSYTAHAGPIPEIDDVLLDSLVVRKADSTKTQHLEFLYSPTQGTGQRLDNHSRYLEQIKVLNSNNAEINTYDFAYSYFGTQKTYDYRNVSLANGDFAQTIGALDSSYPDLNLRLRLDSVTENSISTHSFEYHEQSFIPNKTTLSQDYWGFYNGSFNSDIFIPYAYGNHAQGSIFDQEKQANRIPSENSAKIFSLKKITYPTKGSTFFDYELNTFDQDQNVGEFPLPTVEKDTMASRVSTVATNDDWDTVIITPNQYSTLKITYNVTFTGWDAAQYPSSRPSQEPDWANDFYVELQDMNDNLVRPRIHIPSSLGNTEWSSFGPSENSNYEAIVTWSETEEWSYDVNTGNQLSDPQYKLVAFFNSHNGLYKGLVNIHAQWEDVEIDTEKQFSVGGGLRVSSITEYDNNGELETKRSYNYHYEEQLPNGSFVEKSHGKVKTLPNFGIDQISVLNLAIKYNGYPSDYSPVPVANATSHNSFSKDAGSYVGYDQVEITTVGSQGDNGKTIKKFHNEVDRFNPETPTYHTGSYHQFPPLRVPHNGLLKSETHFKRVGGTYDTIANTEHSYKIDGISAGQFSLLKMYETSDKVISATKELPVFTYGEGGILYWFCDAMKFQLYPHYSHLIQQTGTKETIYNSEGIDSLVTLQEFKYENPAHLQRTESKLINSKGEEVITKTFYPDDVTTLSSLGSPDLSAPEKALIDRLKRDSLLHRIAEPVQTETTINGERTVQRTTYKDWDAAPGPNSYKVWPEFVQTLKGNYHLTDNPMETRLNYLSYDDLGNPLEVSKQDGTTITYIWGYDGKYPVAKIEHATHTQALATTANFNIIDNPATSDIAMRTELQKLRDDLPQAMVTTYTYNPLVGVTSVTDPRGYTMTYSYDTANRLVEVRDADGHLVTDYEYHYKGQSN
ncbi:RHS repeat protein [Ulvibacterium marinum]|uniref:RHS repeat protein n=1 Tax=Ulvibacterium marinum TaxID=2419782 RepID=UPI0024952696|nr:hypothetical protein [Ulvibacterium marinum]